MSFTDLLDSTAYGSAVTDSIVTFDPAALTDVVAGDLVLMFWTANANVTLTSCADNGAGAQPYQADVPPKTAGGSNLTHGFVWVKATGNDFGTLITLQLSATATRRSGTLVAFHCSNGNPNLDTAIGSQNDTVSPVGTGTNNHNYLDSDSLGVAAWGWLGGTASPGWAQTTPAGTHTLAANNGDSGGVTTNVETIVSYDLSIGTTTPFDSVATFTSLTRANIWALSFTDIPDASVAPAFRNVGASSTFGTPGGAFTVAAPINMLPGDLEFLVGSGEETGTLTISNPGGGAWTAVPNTPVSVTGGGKLAIWWRVRAASDTDPNVTYSVDSGMFCRFTVRAGTFDPADPLEIEVSSTEATVDTSFSYAPGNSTSGDRRLCVVVCTSGADSLTGQAGTNTANAALTNIVMQAEHQTTNGLGSGYWIATGDLATAGSVGTWTQTMVTATAKAYAAFAVQPKLPSVVPRAISGTSTGTSTSTATINRRRPLTATSTGSSTTTATLAARKFGSYGEVIEADGLNNAKIGPISGTVQRQLAYAFRAKRTDTLTDVSLWVKVDTPGGYSGGTGGSLRIRIETDDGTGKPSGTLVAAGATVTASTPVGSGSLIQTFTLGTAPALTAGTVYHVVITNVDASPTVNFVSINNLYHEAGTAPLQQTTPDADLHVSVLDGASWSSDLTRYPVLDLHWSGGAHDGQPYYDAASGSGQKSISGTQNLARQNFTPAAAKNAYGAVIRGYRQTTTTQPLVVKLKNAGGTTLDQFSVAASAGPVGNTGTGNGARWMSGLFSAPVALSAGSQYFLELSSPGETVPWIVFPIEQGGSGFGAPLLSPGFSEGYLESTTNGGTLWSTHAGSTLWKMQAFLIVATGDIAATSTSTSTTTATINRLRPLTGTSTGASTTTASINRRRNITGTSTGASTTTATINRRRPLTATSTGTSTTTATLTRRRNLTATSTGASTTTATVNRLRPLTGTSTGASTTTATINRRRPLTATSTGTATSTATINRLRPLTATSTGASTTTATLVRKRALTATSTGASTTTATINRLRPLTATSTGASTTTATITAQHAPVIVQLTATSTGTSTTTATLTRLRPLTATSTGASTTTATLVRKRALVATSTGTSTTTATLVRKRALTATSTGASTTTATLVRKRALVATSTGSSTTTATLARKRAITATSTGASTTTVTLARVRGLVATSAATSTTTANLTVQVGEAVAGTLNCTVQAAAVITVVLTGETSMIVTVSHADGNLAALVT